MDGYLLVDKPTGWTSFDVVAKIRGVLQTQRRAEHEARGACHPNDGGVGLSGKTRCKCKVKVGHTGTLDPAATGLLIILVGKYTKRAAELTKLDKTYEVQLTLGQTSTTGDVEGDLTDVSATVPSLEAVEAAVAAFVGDISQVPPIYSAIKIDGQRAYKLARAGKEVKMQPRAVTIYSNTNVAYDYPHISFTSRVSSGTYIRTLAEDIGKKLTTGAYMSALRRTQVGEFSIKDSILVSKTISTQDVTASLRAIS